MLGQLGVTQSDINNHASSRLLDTLVSRPANAIHVRKAEEKYQRDRIRTEPILSKGVYFDIERKYIDEVMSCQIYRRKIQIGQSLGHLKAAMGAEYIWWIHGDWDFVHKRKSTHMFKGFDADVIIRKSLKFTYGY
jgi:hypothetical protein